VTDKKPGQKLQKLQTVGHFIQFRDSMMITQLDTLHAAINYTKYQIKVQNLQGNI